MGLRATESLGSTGLLPIHVGFYSPKRVTLYAFLRKLQPVTGLPSGRSQEKENDITGELRSKTRAGEKIQARRVFSWTQREEVHSALPSHEESRQWRIPEREGSSSPVGDGNRGDAIAIACGVSTQPPSVIAPPAAVCSGSCNSTGVAHSCGDAHKSVAPTHKCWDMAVSGRSIPQLASIITTQQ